MRGGPPGFEANVTDWLNRSVVTRNCRKKIICAHTPSAWVTSFSRLLELAIKSDDILQLFVQPRTGGFGILIVSK